MNSLIRASAKSFGQAVAIQNPDQRVEHPLHYRALGTEVWPSCQWEASGSRSSVSGHQPAMAAAAPYETDQGSCRIFPFRFPHCARAAFCAAAGRRPKLHVDTDLPL